MDDTTASLGPDGPSWRRLFEPLSTMYDELAVDIMRPVLHVPRHPVSPRPVRAVRHPAGDDAGPPVPADSGPGPCSAGWRRTSCTRCAARSPRRSGWRSPPPATRTAGRSREGGSRAITDALAAVLRQHGGTISTGILVERYDQLRGADIVMLDVAPAAAARILGDRLPRRVARAYQRYRHGPGAFKLDLAVEGGIPWRDEECRRAGTVHLGGTLDEMVATEALVAAGRMPDRPFVLIGQQYLADPSRSAGDLHPVWAYAHVPAGYDGDASEAILAQLERFAPGVRDRVRAQSSRGPADLAAYNPNYVGGDIGTGRNDPRQLLLRPRLGAESVPHRGTGRVPVLGRHPTRGRRPRHVRLPRRPLRPRRPVPLTPPRPPPPPRPARPRRAQDRHNCATVVGSGAFTPHNFRAVVSIVDGQAAGWAIESPARRTPGPQWTKC